MPTRAPYVALALCALAYLCATPSKAATRVAVLVEPGLPAYGGTPSLPAGRMVAALARLGIRAAALLAAEAGDPAKLTVRAFDVLVIPYGNAFPEPAAAAIRAFHAAGGCLVTTGIPFCHPCRKVDGAWRDIGHVDWFGHGPDGLGTAGFSGPQDGVDRLAVAPGNPLGLRQVVLPRTAARLQWLDRGSLAPEDEVVPLVTVAGPDGRLRPASALIRHQCARFRGARDVWIGQVAPETEDADQYAAQQLLARGILWCLAEKGALNAASLTIATGSAPSLPALLARLDALPKPRPLPERLAYRPQPRPWGDTYLPKSSPPARRLMVVDVSKLADDERIALTCLQGLTSRRQPVLWLQRNDYDRFWLDWHKQKGHVDGYDHVSDWPSLFRRFAGAYRGVVVPDPSLYRGGLLAINVASCEDLIIATPELARRLGIPVKVDLRGRFATYAEGLRWVWRRYGSRLSHHLCNWMHPARLANCVFSYDLQWRGQVFWMVGPVDEPQPGTDLLAERRVIAEIMADMAPNVAVMGFPYAGEGVGPGEVGGVGLASRYAKALVCTDFLGNTCVTSGVRVPRLAQPKQPPTPPLQKDKVYIALVMSDGDNQNTWIDFFRRHFDHPAFGRFPLAFGMGPPILELQPAVAQWYYEHASPSTEFIADVSGVAYMQPDNYGRAFAQPDRVLDGFLDWTERLMKPMGMRSVRTVGGGDEFVRPYARRLTFCHSIFADMGRYSGREGIANLTYALEGMPVFRSVTSWRYGKEGFLREVREQVGTQRPAFVNGFVHCWTFDMDALARIYDQRDADMVFVTPSQLAELYRQAQARGWAR